MSTIARKETSPYHLFRNTQKQRVSDGKNNPILSECELASYTLVIVLPQLGDFDSLEYAWWVRRETDFLQAKNIAVRAVGIGNLQSGQKFCQYTGFSEEYLFLDPTADIHKELGLSLNASVRLPLKFSQKIPIKFNGRCKRVSKQNVRQDILKN